MGKCLFSGTFFSQGFRLHKGLDDRARAANGNECAIHVVVSKAQTCHICRVAYEFKEPQSNPRGISEHSVHYNAFNRYSAKLRRRIIQLRSERNLTQEDMQQFELSLRQYQRIEKGETKNITLANLYKIAKAFNVSLSDLLDL